MIENFKVERQGKSSCRWIENLGETKPADIEGRCTKEFIQSAINELLDFKCEVVEVTINTTGTFKAPPLPPLPGIPRQTHDEWAEDTTNVFDGLPEYCQIIVHNETPGNHTEHIRIWVPFIWNNRFQSVIGGGNRAQEPWGTNTMERIRFITMTDLVCNYFACAGTDAANRELRYGDWGVNFETGELDYELIRNWSYRSIHNTTVIAKAVIQAIHGVPPTYSYFEGSSGAGRQALAIAMHWPNDYDGVWSSDGAYNYTRTIPGSVWPSLVMKEYGTILPPEKLQVFREAVWGKVGGREAFLQMIERVDFEARDVIGTPTSEGPITETDATVMQKLWDGARTTTGEFLWYGFRPGTDFWGGPNEGGQPIWFAAAKGQEVNGKLEPYPFAGGVAYLGGWVKHDPDWDWKTLTFEEYEELFNRGLEELAEFATNSTDLAAFRDAGRKLIISHAIEDELLTSECAFDYYRRLTDAMGGKDETRKFARFFPTPGDGHSASAQDGPGIGIATGMVALMNWVENGIAPDTLHAELYDFQTNEVIRTSEIAAY